MKDKDEVQSKIMRIFYERDEAHYGRAWDMACAWDLRDFYFSVTQAVFGLNPLGLD